MLCIFARVDHRDFYSLRLSLTDELLIRITTSFFLIVKEQSYILQLREHGRYRTGSFRHPFTRRADAPMSFPFQVESIYCVELSGIEPLTSCVQGRRSPN